MTDREKVIYDLERCTCHVPDACRDCSKYNAEGILTMTCMESLMSDALELLKEPEPVPVEEHGIDEWYDYYVSCPECGTEWMADADRTHYCPNCGRRVVWELEVWKDGKDEQGAD